MKTQTPSLTEKPSVKTLYASVFLKENLSVSKWLVKLIPVTGKIGQEKVRPSLVSSEALQSGMSDEFFLV